MEEEKEKWDGPWKEALDILTLVQQFPLAFAEET